jgi:hypothetical protein
MFEAYNAAGPNPNKTWDGKDVPAWDSLTGDSGEQVKAKWRAAAKVALNPYGLPMHERIARTCHEANRAYCAALGDESQLPWEEAPEWQRKSAITGVQFHLSHPDSTPADSHNSWLAEKERDGWKWGPEKNAELKVHPCFVPYEQLPAAQQAKDYIFLAIVRALA